MIASSINGLAAWVGDVLITYFFDPKTHSTQLQPERVGRAKPKSPALNNLQLNETNRGGQLHTRPCLGLDEDSEGSLLG